MTRAKPSQMMNWRGLSKKTTMIRLKIVAKSRMRAVTILVRRQKRGETKEMKPQLTMINYKLCTSMTLECMKYSDLYRIHVVCTSWQTLWDAEMFELVPSKKNWCAVSSLFFSVCAHHFMTSPARHSFPGICAHHWLTVIAMAICGCSPNDIIQKTEQTINNAHLNYNS